MPRYYRGVWGRTHGAPATTDVLVMDRHGGQGQRLLRPSFQGIPQSYPCRPPVPHALQRGHGSHHPPLGGGGGGNIGRHGGTWPVDTGLGVVIFFQQWTRRLNPTREDAAGVQLPYMPFRPGRPEDEYTEDD